MGSSVGALSNYYEMLELSPTASQDEIAQAFTKAMGMFSARPMDSAAQIALAFETLRNPAKRRAYDASLEVRPRPKLADAPAAVSFRISARAAGSEAHVEEHLGQSLPAVPPAPVPEAEPDAPAEPRIASFIASSLREIASPAPLGGPVEPKAEPQESTLQVVPAGEAEHAAEAEKGSRRLKPIAAAAGGLILAAGLIGAVAGIAARDPAPQQPAVTSSVPAATVRQVPTIPAAPATTSAPMANAAEAQPQLAAPPKAAQRPRHSIIPQQPRSWVDQQLAESQPVESAPPVSTLAETVTDQLAPNAKPDTAEPVAASLPLSKGIIAQTIERIGYSCGDVSSTTPVDHAAPGAYKVTCTSGDTYRATPVRGRYHFRRLPAQ